LPLRLISAGIGSTGIGLIGLGRKIEIFKRRVSRIVRADHKDPGLLFPPACVEKLELGVRNSTEFRVFIGRFRSVSVSHELNEAFTGIDLVSQPVAKLAVPDPEVFL
jgi:hypothetical protein